MDRKLSQAYASYGQTESQVTLAITSDSVRPELYSSKVAPQPPRSQHFLSTSWSCYLGRHAAQRPK